ncbi:hypothetical protein PAXINDRAFT_164394 [Paxillus involutus ATCC 200175]|uniref:DUF6589 domain-containing protein n=1 Tax=Paxillus involutus ATCC 200175 TaxID=664439 RepID=A0A0C9TQ55_PAXIN|nr:hypothetical protein PAXINDRAFT_164394 [Paxillus involutus ATCC 200175]
MSKHVIIVHGDLLTKERIDSIQESRHALWRIWVQPKEAQTDVNAFYQHIGILRPREGGKFTTKPGFRRMHDVIHHDLWASILNCWAVEASKQNSAWGTLEAFAKSKPSWELIEKMSDTIMEKYVATTTNLTLARDRLPKECDKHFENQALRNRDELLYIDICHTMNSGDVGHVEASLLPWIYMFKATGKHKYAYQMMRFMIYMWYVYPDKLKHIIRMNWLCNPTGKAFKFRAVDWLVERNNLYTKVIFAGKGSNRTIEHILKESPLIELYRGCHVLIEDAFHIQGRTINHAPPDMTKILQKLGEEICKNSPHVFKPGRGADNLLMDDKAAVEDIDGEDDSAGEVNADDIAAE